MEIIIGLSLGLAVAAISGAVALVKVATIATDAAVRAEVARAGGRLADVYTRLGEAEKRVEAVDASRKEMVALLAKAMEEQKKLNNHLAGFSGR